MVSCLSALTVLLTYGVSRPLPPRRLVEEHLREARPVIPPNLFFTYKDTNLPMHLERNVQNTITAYKAVMPSNMSLHFLVDSDCRNQIRLVEPALLEHFDAEKHGMYKADICRVAALYLSGGYYFDVDVKVVKPFITAPSTTFSTVRQDNTPDEFFQAFMASTPRHPILKKAIELMLSYYNGSYAFRKYMGTSTLYDAYAAVAPEEREHAQLLHEMELLPSMFPEVARQSGSGCCCNYVVGSTETLHFFSRIPGTQHC